MRTYTSKYFTEKELTCGCGCGDHEMDPYFLRTLDNLRESLGVPLVLNSAKRCAKHNKDVGGVPSSAHVTGNAADIRVNGGVQRYNIISRAVLLGVKRIGVAKSFIHVDTGVDLPSPSIWVY